jgi:SAM-dependent MidA family methyltransferase
MPHPVLSPSQEAVVERVRRFGPRPADEVIELALYGDEGFYVSGGAAGRRGDFLTSPEVGPLFGAVVARALDACWEALDRADPFVVVEGGAGAGVLAKAVLRAEPACSSALRWVCVERSPLLRALAASGLAVEPSTHVLGGPPGSGPVVTVVEDLPAGPFTGVVFANELLDNLPPAIAEMTDEGWAEVRVGESSGRLVEVLVPSDDVARSADRWVPEAATGRRIPLVRAAARWVETARSTLEAGWVLCIDYGTATTAELAELGFDGWLRTYRGHRRGKGWLEDLGLQDVTSDVPADQLQPASIETQAAWLRRWGIDAVVEEARRTWHEHAAVGDLRAVKARSRVGEANALLDGAGLGAYLVLQWPVGGVAVL